LQYALPDGWLESLWSHDIDLATDTFFKKILDGNKIDETEAGLRVNA
jgi:hypothetical protein